MASIEIDGANGVIKSTVSDSDLTIKGNDGGSEISALTFDMSDAGTATFNHDIALSTDGAIIKIAADNDLQLTHSGSAGDITCSTGALDINASTLNIKDEAGSEIMASFTSDGTVSLRYDNTEKLLTSSTGINLPQDGDGIKFGVNSEISLLHVHDAGLELTAVGNLDTLRLVSTDDDANVGPVLVLHRNSASPADNDIIGNIIFAGEDSAGNETDFMRFDCAASDKTNGAEDGQLRIMGMLAGSEQEFIRLSPNGFIFNEGGLNLNFRIESDSLNDMLFVDGGNNRVGIGTDAPDYTFQVDSPSSVSTYATNIRSLHTSNPFGIFVKYTSASPDGTDNQFFVGQDSGTNRILIVSNGDVKNHDGNFTSISSDERLKSNITDANSQWDDIKAIKFRNFKKKDDIEEYGADNAKTLIGVVAQEAEAVTPKLVENRDPYVEEIKLNSVFGTLYEDGDIIPEGKEIGDVKEVKEQVKTFKDSILFWKCAKALQEAIARIEALEAK